MYAVESPFPIYTDTRSGLPLDGGNLYFGTVNTNPETNPITVYWDAAGTQPAAQPIRTIGGLPCRAGTPSSIFVPGDYSLTVRDAFGRLVSTRGTSIAGTVIALFFAFASSIGASLVGFIQAGIGAVLMTVQSMLRLNIVPEQFGAVGDGVTDDTAAILRFVAALAALSGPAYDDTMGQSPYHYATTKRGKLLSGKKYGITQTIDTSGNVSIDFNGGGFLALAGFPAGAYMVDTGTAPNCGTMKDMALDGAGLNCKGVNIQNAFNSKWNKVSVTNCANDGLTYTAGSDFILETYHLSCAATPNSNAVAGLRILGSDGTFGAGSIEFYPQPVVCSGAGNNTFSAIHCWGEYAAFRSYVMLTLINSSRNTFFGFYFDSPTKQDYTQGNLAVVGGQVNGGIGVYIDANSAQNTFHGPRGYANPTQWDAYRATLPGPPAAAQFIDFYIAGQFNNIFGLTHNYIGNYWTTDILFASNAVRDSTLVLGSPSTSNGFRTAVLGSRADAGGSIQDFSVENTNAGFATSGASVSWVINGGAISTAQSIFGPSGASYWRLVHLGNEALRVTPNGTVQSGADNTQNLGAAGVRWSTIYAATGTINTSDEREKQDIRSLSDAEKAVGTALRSLVKAYRWKASVAAKDDGARIHVGWIAQEAMAAFTAQGLDPFAYGVCCHDIWDAEPEILSEDGVVTRAALAAGDRYGLRHDELVAFILGTL